MNVRTRLCLGVAIQYDGTNIQEIADSFNLEYKEYCCTTLWNGKEFPDVHVWDSDYFESDLLAGDYIYKDSSTNLIRMIPLYEFEAYWEEK